MSDSKEDPDLIEIDLTEHDYLVMYDSIQWKNINISYFNNFAQLLEEDSQIMNLMESVYNMRKIPGSDNILVKFINSDNSKRDCDDRVAGFFLRCIGDLTTGTHTQIFHIALHSRMPKWDDGCKYYKSTPSNIKNPETFLGPFHYKIDRVSPLGNHAMSSKDYMSDTSNNRKCKSENFDKLKNQPFKRLFYDESCYFIENDDEFRNKTVLLLNPDCEYLHKLIYNKFIDYWNTKILPEVKIPRHPLPPPPTPLRSLVTKPVPPAIAVLSVPSPAVAVSSSPSPAKVPVAAPAPVPARELDDILRSLSIAKDEEGKRKIIEWRNDKSLNDKLQSKEERTTVNKWVISGRGGSLRNKRLLKKSKITKQNILRRKSRRINYM
jgi:hypothetical protein